MMPHTFRNIMRPRAPPTPIESDLLLARLLPFTVRLKVSQHSSAMDMAITRTRTTIANTRPSLINAGTFLITKYSMKKTMIGEISQTRRIDQTLAVPPALLLALTSDFSVHIAKYIKPASTVTTA